MDGHKTENFDLENKRREVLHTDNEESDELARSCGSSITIDSNRIKSLEQEQEALMASLIALSSHFAHVQFRLRQVVDAPPCDRELLIKKLEDFASKGIPEVNNNANLSECEDIISNLEQAHREQFDLIERLKDYMMNLEKLQCGSGIRLRRQCKTHQGHLSSGCDQTIDEFVGPPEMRHCVITIRSQISDLEELVGLLHYGFNFETAEGIELNEISEEYGKDQQKARFNKRIVSGNNKTLKSKMSPAPATSLMQRLHSMAYMAMNSLGLHVNFITRNFGVNKWAGLQTQFKKAIEEILSLAVTLESEKICKSSNCAASNEAFWVVTKPFCLTNVQLVALIRGKFAEACQKLMQHGLYRKIYSAATLKSTLTYFKDNSYTCNNRANVNGPDTAQEMHAWELILQYCNITNVNEYIEISKNDKRKVSLLNAVKSVKAVRSQYTKSYNSHFKAFICAGFNSQQLDQWLELIFQCKHLIHTYYTSWSYVAQTEFRDALNLINPLMIYNFDIPINMTIGLPNRR